MATRRNPAISTLTPRGRGWPGDGQGEPREQFMKKASRSGGMTKPAQKRPAQKKLVTKSAKPKKAQDGARLAEVVTQLALSAEKLAQAADRLAEATARLLVIGV